MEYKKISEEEIKEKVEQHKLWLDSDETEGQQADFSGYDLSNVVFADRDLRYADFSVANLENADFSGANLTSTNFYFARCINAYFVWSDTTDIVTNLDDIENGSFDGARFSHGAFVGGEFIEERD